MALLDFLKQQTFRPLSGVGQTFNALSRQRPSGFEPLNPEAARIRLSRLQAQNAPQRALNVANASLSQNRTSASPGGAQGLQGTIPGGLPAPAPVAPLSVPQDANALARQQLEQETRNLAQYGTAVAPGPQTPIPTGAGPSETGIQGGQAKTPEQVDVQTGEVIPPSPRFADLYRNIYQELGLGDIRGQLETTGRELQELQDKKVDDISLVNENPWLTEGQRQDRVNAINKKYEQREANLINRIDLFQSTFEQGRQEAQFIASQTAEEQRVERQAQLDLLERQFQAEQKLREKGQEILSVADARALGVPYGTTVAEARQLGVVPEAEEKLGPGIVGEYQFYAQQEAAAGRQPLTFDEYQTRDANRKLKAASAAGGAGDLSKLLSITEAQALGVPYGTTKGEAIGLFATGASGEAAKLRGIVNTLPSEITQLRSILEGASRTKLASILSGLDPATNRLIDQVADKVGRLRSGGAINKDEEARFKGQLIRKADLISGDTSSAISALDGIAEEARQVAQGIRVSQPSPTGTQGTTSGGMGYTVYQ